MPPGKVHELAFLWFGLLGPLLKKGSFHVKPSAEPSCRTPKFLQNSEEWDYDQGFPTGPCLVARQAP